MTKGDDVREWTLDTSLISGLLDGNADGSCMHSRWNGGSAIDNLVL
jgi:hypothetical protein